MISIGHRFCKKLPKKWPDFLLLYDIFKFDTISKYCIYDEPHNDYLYSEDWVSLIVRLLRDGIITKETLREFCAQSRVVSEYESR